MTPLAQRQTNSERLTGRNSYYVRRNGLWLGVLTARSTPIWCAEFGDATCVLWTPEEVEARLAEFGPGATAQRARP